MITRALLLTMTSGILAAVADTWVRWVWVGGAVAWAITAVLEFAGWYARSVRPEAANR